MLDPRTLAMVATFPVTNKATGIHASSLKNGRDLELRVSPVASDASSVLALKLEPVLLEPHAMRRLVLE